MSIINAVILGLVESVAEFLPISGSGHLAIVQNLFGLTAADGKHVFFNVLLQLAALVSVCIVYRQDLTDLFNDCVTLFTTNDPKLRDKSRLGARQVLMMLVSVLPLLLILPYYSRLQALQARTVFIGLQLILTGTMLYVSDKFLPGKKDGKSITIIDALVIGVSQTVGLLPGLSRCAAALTACLCCGINKEYAVKYSFLISIPALFGGVVISFAKLFRYGIDLSGLPAYFIGTAVALIGGVLAVGLMQAIAKRSSFGKFRHYCWGAGVITIFLTAIL